MPCCVKGFRYTDLREGKNGTHKPIRRMNGRERNAVIRTKNK
jgi:hypothetical protein